MDASAPNVILRNARPSNVGLSKTRSSSSRSPLVRSPLRLGAAIAVGVLLLSMLAAIAPRNASAVGERGDLTWAQEFNASAGTAPDSTAWTQETGGWGWGNAELQNYTTKNAVTDGKGNLVITARKEASPGESCWYGPCEYTSARLISSGKFSQQYGRFEARIKVPSGVGTLPAFWMLGSDIFTTNPWPASGEIDIMEVVGHTPGTLHGSLHSPDYNAANSLTGTTRLPGGGVFSDSFHVYAVEWTPTGVTWLLDDVPYLTITREQAGARAWPFDKPFFLILNLAIGGVWPGSPTTATRFPMEMLVDYVRVYELGVPAVNPEPTPSPSPSPSASSPTTIPGVDPAEGTVGTVVGLGGKCLSAPMLEMATAQRCESVPRGNALKPGQWEPMAP